MASGDPNWFGSLMNRHGSPLGSERGEGEASAGRRRRRAAEDLGDGFADRSVRRRVSPVEEAAGFPASAGHGISGVLQADFVPAWDESFPADGFFDGEVDPPENQVSAESWPTRLLPPCHDDESALHQQPPQPVIVEYDFLANFDVVRAGDDEPEDIDPFAGMRMDTDSMSYEGFLGLGERMGQVKPKRKLSEAEALDRIREVALLSDEEEEEEYEEICTICQEAYADNEQNEERKKLGFLRCGHFCHHKCLLDWLQTEDAACPLCRQEPHPLS